MKKKALLLASIGALVCTVGATALAFGGAIHLDAFAVKADPTEYSVTFDEDSTVKAVGDNYAIYTTTPRGAKVGVVGFDNRYKDFTFNSVSFRRLKLYDYSSLLKGAGAFEFSTITGFAISFSGGSVLCNGGSTYIEDVVSGYEYTELSITPDWFPEFTVTNGSVTVSSLKIMYSC